MNLEKKSRTKRVLEHGNLSEFLFNLFSADRAQEKNIDWMTLPWNSRYPAVRMLVPHYTSVGVISDAVLESRD